jgi:hypothetical protein
VGDLAGVAEAGGASLNAVDAVAGAVWVPGKVHRICVEHRLGDLDEDQVGDREHDQRGEEQPR